MICCYHLGQRALWDPDEGRYAEIARGILVENDWMTPHLNYLLYFEKPMMFMWMVAASFKIFGFSEWAARLIPCLSALGGIALIWLMARDLWGNRAGIVASLSLITSIEYFILARTVDINMTLTLFITATMVFFWLGHKQGKGTYYLLAWACAGLAVLTKGPIGVILPLGGIGLYIIITRQWSSIKESMPIVGIMVFLAVSLPWYVTVCLKNPDFFSFFFIDQNIMRYVTNECRRYQPWWYFFPVIIGGFLPWSVLIPEAIRRAFTGKGNRKVPGEIWYIASWFGVIFLFFSLSNSKVATYVLPCFPPLSLFIGYLFRENYKRSSIGFICAAFLWLVLGAGLILYPELVSGGILKVSDNLVPLMDIGCIMGVIILVGTFAGVWLGKRYNAVAGFACLGIAFMIVVISFAPRWDYLRSTKALIHHVPEDARLCAYVRYFPSSSFYAERRVYLVDSRGELVFGQARCTEKEYIMTRPEFYTFMKQERNVYCLAYDKYLGLIKENVPGLVMAGHKGDLWLVRGPKE